MTREVEVGGRPQLQAPATGLVDTLIRLKALVVAPREGLLMALDFTIADGKIVAVDAIADPERRRALDLALLHE